MRHASKAASSAPAQRVFDLPVAVYVLDADFSKQSTVGGHVFSCVNRKAVARLRRLRVNAVDERREAARCTRYRTCSLHFAWRLRMRGFLSRRCVRCSPGKLHGGFRRHFRVNASAMSVHFALKNPLPRFRTCQRTQATGRVAMPVLGVRCFLNRQRVLKKIKFVIVGTSPCMALYAVTCVCSD